LIAREQYFETRLLGCVQKQTVLRPAPTHFVRDLHIARIQETA
jgi:hypothetical protein